MAHWIPNSQQITSFEGWEPRFKTVKGPATFWSFSSRENRLLGEPMFWMESETLINCFDKTRQKNDFGSFHEFIRQRVALREDWGNDLKWAFELKLVEGDSVEAWVGSAKAQQAAMNAGRLQQRAKDGLSLVFWGGARQYLINQKESYVLSMISPPYLTETFFNCITFPK